MDKEGCVTFFLLFGKLRKREDFSIFGIGRGLKKLNIDLLIIVPYILQFFIAPKRDLPLLSLASPTIPLVKH